MEVSKFGLIWAFVLTFMIVSVQAQRKKAGPPLNVRSTGHTQTSVSFTWTAPKKLPVGGHVISGYKILYKQEGQGDAAGKKIDVPADTSYTVTDLAPGTTYMFKIATITSNGKVGGFTSWNEVRTEDAPATPAPDPPRNVRGSADGTNINMEWTPPRTPIDGYVVSYGKNSVDENSMEVGQEEQGATISGLDAGATYQVAVQSVSGGQRSSAETFSATTGVPVPSAPGNLRLRSTSDSIDAEWAHNSVEQDGVTGFEVSVGPDSNPTEQTVNLGSSDRFTTVSGLQPDQVYVVSVKAQNEFGSSQPVSDKISTQPGDGGGGGGGGGGGAANSPPNGMQIREGSDRATVTWEAATNDVDGYVVNMGTEANPNQFTQRVPSGNRRRMKQDGLEPDTDYQVSIKSFDSEGESEPIQQGFRTRPRETGSRGARRPTGTKVKPRYDSLGVEWEEPEGEDVDGYRLEVGTPSNPRQFTRDYEPGTTSADVTGLTPDTDYQVNLVSKSSSGDSEPVRRRARTRQTRRPQRPQQVGASSSSPDSIDVNWQAPRDDSVTGFRVDVGIPSDPQRTFSQRYPARTTRASIPGLQENSEYQVSVVSTSASGESEPVRKSVKTQVGDTRRPPSPNGMRVREGTETATVNWEAASGDVDEYVVNMGTADNPNQFSQRVQSGNRRRVRQSGLEPDTDYQVSINSVKEGRESEPIQQGFRTRPRRAEPTRPPTGVRVNTRYDSMAVQWEEPEDENVDGYRLQVGTPSDPQQFVEEYPRGTAVAAVPDLDPDTNYQVSLVSTAQSGESSPVRRRARTRRTRRPKRPQRTRASSSSPDSIDVTWQDPDDENVDGYRVDVGTPSNPRSKFSRRIPRGTNSVNVPGLDADSDYQVSVTSTSPSGDSEPVKKTASTQRRGPGGISPPNGMQLNEEPSSVRVNWGASGSDNIDGYVVSVGTRKNPNQFTENVPKTSRTFRQKGLRPGTDYQASVKAYNADGESEPIQQGFRTKPKRTRGPEPPVNMRANTRYDSIAVRWDEPDDENVDGYRLEVGTPDEPNQASWNFPRGTQDFTIPDLDPDTDYDVKLYSTSPSGDSEPIRRRGRTRRNRRPRRPARAKVNPSSDSMDISWDEAKGDNVDGYRVDVGTPSNPQQFSQQYPRDTTRTTVPGLDPDTEYQVQIVTNAAGRESEPLTKSARTRAPGSRPATGGAANSPPNGMQIREGSDRATVNWEAATNDVDGYIVNMGTEDNPNQFTQRVPSSDRRRIKQDGLEPETDYQVSIKSFDSEGESEPIQQGFRTRPTRTGSPQPPTGTKVNRRYDSLGVEWEEPEGDDIEGYRLEVGTPSNPRQFTRDYEPGTTSADVPGLTPDTDYQVNLVSRSRSGDSEPVRRRARTRPTRRPQRPQRTRASSSSPDSIDVNWEAPRDESVDGYRVDVGTPANPRRDFSRRFGPETSRASIPNLRPDSEYQVSVVSTSQSKESEPVRKSVKTQDDGTRRPSRPNGMRVREGIESATVNWEPATNDVDGYIVNMGTEANPNQFTQRVPSRDRRRFRQDGLEPDTDYQVAIKSFDSSGESEPIQQGFRTRSRRPQATKPPTGVRTNPRYDSMGVQWEEPEDENVDGYRLEVGTPSDPRQFVGEYDRGTTAANVPDLDPETDYQVNLVSTSPSGDSEPVRRRARTRRTRRPKRPQRTRASSSRPDSIEVNWQDPDDENVDGYRVDVGTPSNPRSKFSRRIPRGTNSVRVPGLDEDSEYQVSVVSTSPSGESDPVRKSVKTQRRSPRRVSPPNGMQLNEEPSAVRVNWGASGSDNIDGYVVNIGTPNNPTQFSQNVPKTTTSLRQKGLRPNTDYQVSVKARGPDGESDPIQQGFRTQPKRPEGPAAPVNTKANTRYDSIAVKWDEPDDENVDGYRLEVGTPDEPNQASWKFPRGTRDFTIPDLDPDTDYEVKLYSTSPSGDSEPIRRRGRTRRNRRPKRPARAKVNPGSDSMDVSWDEAKGDNIDGYRVDVGTPSNPRQFSQRFPRGTTRASFPGLDPDTDYQVNIVSTTPAGEESEPLTKASRTGSRPGGSPGGATNSPPNGMQIREGSDRATVNWEPATNDVDGYIVNMGTEDNPNQFTQRVPSTDRKRIRQDGLEPETDYQVSIKSFDSEGESEPIQQGFRTRPRRTGTPQPPTGTKVNRRYDSLGVEWEEPEGDDIEGYRLEVGTPSNPRQFTRDYEPGTTSADVPGLTPNTDYQVNLVSRSRSGDSEPVRRRVRTRPTRRPQRPQRTRASSSSPDSVDVDWEAPRDESVNGYRVDVGTPANPRRDFSRQYGPETRRASIPNLHPDSQYQVSVVSTSPSGESEPARKSVKTSKPDDGTRRPSRPNGMRVREGVESATVNWEPATNDVDGYIVNMGTEANPNQFTQRVPSRDRRRFRQDGLEPDTDYQVSIKSFDSEGESEPIQQGFRTRSRRPQTTKPPTGVRTNPRYDSMGVQWEEPEDENVDGYRLEVGTPSDPRQFVQEYDRGTTAANVPDLDPETDYQVNLVSTSPSGDSEPVKRKARTRRTRRPKRPQRTRASSSSPDSIDVTWQDPDDENVNGYRVDVGTPSNPRSKFSQRVPRGTNSVRVPGLEEDSSYQVSVASTSPSGESDPVRKSVKTQRRSPRGVSPPNGMQLKEEPSSVTINWGPSGSDNINGYVVNIGTPDNPTQFTQNVPKTTTSFRQKGLRPGTDYQVSVKARGPDGESDPIQQGFRTKPERPQGPAAPVNTKANTRYDSIAVKWDEPDDENVDGYRLEVGTPDEPNQASWKFPRGTRDFTIPDLDPDTDYEVKLYSTSPSGDSEPIRRRGRTRRNRRPKRPARSKVNPGSDSMDISWDEAKGDNIDGYRVDVGTSSNPRQFTQRFPRGTTRASFPGLDPDTDYQVSIVSTSADEESEPLTKAARTGAPSSRSGTGGAANSPPNGMQIREGSDRATVTWEPATNDVDGYIVNMGTEDNPNQFTQRVPSTDRKRIRQDGLEPERDYQVSIKSFDSEGESEPIQQGFRTRPRRTGNPQAPTGTKVNRRYDSLGVEWEEPEGDDVEGYRLEVGTPSNPRQFRRDYERGTTSADVPGLTPDTDYQVNLVSRSRSGDSEPVRRRARTRPTRRPQRPQRTRASSSSPDSVDVNWEAPRDESVNGYRVDVGTPADPRRDFSRQYGPETRRASIPNLRPDSQYQVSVVSTSPSGESEPARNSVKTPKEDDGTRRPSRPNGMRVREGVESATVNWEPASNDVDGYIVNMGTEANPNQFTQRVPSRDRRRFRQDGLEPDTDYQVSIKSFDSEGESEPIQEGFRTRSRRPQTTKPPTGVRTNPRYDSMGVQWEEPEDENVDGYRLEVGTPSDPRQFVQEYDRGTTAANVPDLDPETDYQVNLVSTSPSGDSEPVRRKARTRRTRRPKRPQRTRASSSSPDSIDVTWQDPDDENVDGYRVDVGTPSNPRSKFSQRIPRGTNSVRVPGLEEDSGYQVSVVSTSPSGESDPVRKSLKTQRRSPRGVSPPNGMRLKEEPSAVTVNWGPSGSDNIDGYVVNIGTPDNPAQFTQNVPKTTTSLRQEGLRPGTDYQVSVKARGPNGESDPIQQGFRTKPKRPRGPAAPDNTKANTRYDAIAVKWDEPDDENVDGYRLEVGTPDEPNQASWKLPRGTRDFTIPDLDPDTDYEVKLYSTSPSGDSEPITRRGRTRRNRRPKRPARSKVNPGSDSMDISWDEAKGDNIDGYRVDVGTASNPRQFTQRFPRGTTRASFPGLDPDTDYQVSIVSTSADEESEPLTKAARTGASSSRPGTGGAANSPPNGMQIREGSDRATVTWEPSTNDVDGYIVNMGTEDNPNQFTQRVPSRDRKRIRQDGLEPERDYQVSIKSFDSEGESEPIQQGFRTRPSRTGSPQPPTGTKVNRRYDSLGVEWEEPEGDDVEGYRLEVGTPSNPRQFTRDYERGTTSADVPGLTPDTDYQVSLVSRSRSGDSEPVRRRARTRPTRRPQRPQRTRASSSSPDSVDVSWEAPRDESVSGYRVDVGTPADPRRDFSRQYGPETRRASIPNLRPDSQYQVSVVSTSPSGESEPARKSVKTQDNGARRPSRPNGMRVREGIESATVNWEPATNDVDGYIVNMGTEANPNQFTQRVPSRDRRRFRQDGLEPDTDYQVSIKSFDSEGESEPIQQGFRTRSRRPQTTKPPTGVRTNPRYDSMGVQWEEPEDENVDGYRLEVGTPSDPRQFVREYDRGTTAANVPDLDPETDYQVNLVSKSPSGDSEPVRRKARTRHTRRPQRPQRTRASSSSPDSIDVNWQDPDDENVDGYRVDVGTPSDPRSKFSQRVPRGTNSVRVPGLEEDSGYQVSVVSTSPSGESDPVRKSVKTQRRRPRGVSPPNGMQVNEDPSAVRVNWGPSGSDNIDGYIVNIGTPDNPTQFTQNVPKTTTSLRQKGLRPETDYQVSVKARGPDGESDPIQQGFRTRPKRTRGPEAPVNTRANTRYDSIAVSWDEPDDENVDGYRLEVGTPDEPIQASWKFPRGTRDFTIPDLDPDTDYDVRLYSTSPSGDSEPIRRRGRTRRNRRPKRPARSKVNPGSDSMDVTWDEAKGDNIDGYRVDVGTPANPRQFSQRFPYGTTRASFPGLDPDTDYQVNIVSTTSAGEESEPLTKDARTRAPGSRPATGGAANSPPNGMQIREGSDRATVTWEPATNDVDGYIINMGTEANPNQFTQRVPSTDRRRIRQDGLEPDTDYQVSIKSFDSEGESEPIQQGFRTRSGQSRNPSPPTGTRVNRRYDSLGVEWEEPEGDDVEGYRLEVGTPSNPRQFTRDYERGTTSADIPGLTPDTEYQVNLVSTSPSGESETVRRKARTRPTRRPQRPQGTRATSSSPDSIDVNWQDPNDENVDGYRVDVGTPSNPRSKFSQRIPRGTNSVRVPGLDADSEYQVSVVSTSPSGESEPVRKSVKTPRSGSRQSSPPNGLRLDEDAESVDINWGASGSDNIEGYIVNIGPPDNPTQFSQRVPRSTNFRQSRLRPETDYQVSVQAYGPDGESEPVRQGFRTRPSRSRNPRPPVHTKANSRYDSIAMRWEEPDDDSVTGYRMEVGTPSDPNQFSMPFPRGTTDFTIPDLDPNTDYEVKLYSTSPSGDSEPIRRRVRTRKNRRPKRPSGTRVTPGANSLDVSWDQAAGDNIAGYRLDVGTPSNPRQFSRRLPADTRRFSVPGLDPDTDYQVSLVSNSADGESEPVTRQARTGGAGVPGAPETPSGVDVSAEGNNLRVRWNPQRGVSGYIVRAGRASNGFPPNEVTERVNSRKDQALLRSLQPDTDYLVSVSSVNQAGEESRPARASGRTDQALPGRPEGLAAETSTTSATLTWRAPGTPIDGYTLSLGTVTFPNIVTKELGPNVNEYTFDDLDPDTIYTAELTSYNPAGSSMPVSAKLRTEPGPGRSPPDAPNRMELTATPSRINIRWEPSSGDFTGYRIRLTDPATGQSETVEVDKFQQNYAFTDLEPEKQYEVSIESFNDEGYSRPVVDRVTTGELPGGSEQPQNVDIVATGTRIDAHWNPPLLPRNARPHSYMVIVEAIDEEGNPLGPRDSVTLHHSQNEHTFTNLLPATRYRVSVAANIEGELTTPIVQEVITSMDGPIPPINTMAEPISPNAISVSWDFPVETGPPPEVGGRRPDIYYTVRVSNPETGDIYANSREMSTDVEGLRPDTLYDVQVAMVYNGMISDYGDNFAVRTFSDVDPRSPQFPTVTQVLLESPDNVHATLNWLPPREDAENVRTYNTEYSIDENPTLDNTTWNSVSSDASDLGAVISNLPTNGFVHYRTQPVYRGGEKGPFSVLQTFSTPVAERPTPADQPCQSHEDVTRQRINQITERTVPPLGMPLPYCDQFFTDFPCVWSPVCICIPRGTKSLGALPQSIRPASGSGCSTAQQRDDPSAMYRDEPPRISDEPGPCHAVFAVTLEAIKESHKNAVPLMASSLPSCREDGYYNSIQCMGTMCLCVDRMGQPTGEMTEIWNVNKLRCT